VPFFFFFTPGAIICVGVQLGKYGEIEYSWYFTTYASFTRDSNCCLPSPIDAYWRQQLFQQQNNNAHYRIQFFHSCLNFNDKNYELINKCLKLFNNYIINNND
jgi:hypothetical protein